MAINLENVLIEYGLSPNQSKVYLACLELGSSTVYKISHRAGLPRTTCYQVIETLRPLGLISLFQKKKTLYVSAENPKTLLRSAQEKVTMLDKALPNFLHILDRSASKPSLRFYQGREGIKTTLEEIVQDKKEVSAFSSTDDVASALGKDFDTYIKNRAASKVPSKVIMRDSPRARMLLQTGPSELRQVRIVPSSFEHHSLVFIWGNKVAMLFSDAGDFGAFVIESEKLAQFHKATFDYIWKSIEGPR
jgi:sugar-specific transcriptional regulator TrmB